MPCRSPSLYTPAMATGLRVQGRFTRLLACVFFVWLVATATTYVKFTALTDGPGRVECNNALENCPLRVCVATLGKSAPL